MGAVQEFELRQAVADAVKAANSDNMASWLAIASAPDAARSKLQELIAAKEALDAATRAHDEAQLAAVAERETADRRIAEAERRGAEVAEHAETHRKRHAQQDADLRVGLAEFAQQRLALEAEHKIVDGKREAHAAMIKRLRQHLDEVAL